VQAAQALFASGVPLLVSPLDSTADLKLTPEMRARIFVRGTPLTDALAARRRRGRRPDAAGLGKTGQRADFRDRRRRGVRAAVRRRDARVSGPAI
jgi:hypothetical protein